MYREYGGSEGENYKRGEQPQAYRVAQDYRRATTKEPYGAQDDEGSGAKDDEGKL